MSEVGNGSQTFDVESDEDESLRQENDEEESQDGSDEDEDFEDDGEAGNFEVSGTDEDEESEDRGEADRYEELHCYRCKAELNVNCTTDIITYCRTCVDDNCKEMSTLGSSVAENLKTVALLKEQLAKVTQAVAGLRYQLTTKQAENQRLNMKLKVAKLEARDAKRHLREALASRRRPLQRPSSKAPPC